MAQTVFTKENANEKLEEFLEQAKSDQHKQDTDQALLTLFRETVQLEAVSCSELAHYKAVRDYLANNGVETDRGSNRLINELLARLITKGSVDNNGPIPLRVRQATPSGNISHNPS